MVVVGHVVRKIDTFMVHHPFARIYQQVSRRRRRRRRRLRLPQEQQHQPQLTVMVTVVMVLYVLVLVIRWVIIQRSCTMLHMQYIGYIKMSKN